MMFIYQSVLCRFESNKFIEANVWFNGRNNAISSVRIVRIYGDMVCSSMILCSLESIYVSMDLNSTFVTQQFNFEDMVYVTHLDGFDICVNFECTTIDSPFTNVSINLSKYLSYKKNQLISNDKNDIPSNTKSDHPHRTETKPIPPINNKIHLSLATPEVRFPFSANTIPRKVYYRHVSPILGYVYGGWRVGKMTNDSCLPPVK